MSIDNPLFPDEDEKDNNPGGYLLPGKSGNVAPLDAAAKKDSVVDPAANFIRQKLDRIYAEEPNVSKEIDESKTAKPRSKHQQFMYDLSTSGKSLADIQTEWHNYYIGLPDDEKHKVWQEFYESNAHSAYYSKPTAKPAIPAAPVEAASDDGVVVGRHEPATTAAEPADSRSIAAIRQSIKHHVSAGGKLKAKHHIQSLLFGLGMGLLVVFVFLFGFFNEFFIAPFIQPSRTASATPIILDPASVTPSSTPEVIIPKINVEIPADYTQTSTDENVIENALQNGVVHYPNTVMPGQNGNAAFFGHSSNNIFNKGKYKFAFVLLHELVPGDTFYLTYNGKVYAYKVITKDIVDPTDVGVLGPVAGQTATATLITCDPPGTSLHRLIIVGQQISPDVSTNTKGTTAATTASTTPTQLASNGPTLLSKVSGTLFGKLLLTGTGGILVFLAWWTWKQWRIS
jgi:sortase A